MGHLDNILTSLNPLKKSEKIEIKKIGTFCFHSNRKEKIGTFCFHSNHIKKPYDSEKARSLFGMSCESRDKKNHKKKISTFCLQSLRLSSKCWESILRWRSFSSRSSLSFSRSIVVRSDSFSSRLSLQEKRNKVKTKLKENISN